MTFFHLTIFNMLLQELINNVCSYPIGYIICTILWKSTTRTTYVNHSLLSLGKNSMRIQSYCYALHIYIWFKRLTKKSARLTMLISGTKKGRKYSSDINDSFCKTKSNSKDIPMQIVSRFIFSICLYTLVR